MKHIRNVLIILFFAFVACLDQNNKIESQSIIAESPILVLDEIEINENNYQCPYDMVLVDGEYCSNLDMQCAHMGGPKHHVCQEFAQTKCMSKKTRHMNFCMDKYEWPNEEGIIPDVMFSFLDLDKMCKSIGKRLCADVEFIKACEGPENKPYPYGYVRNDSICNIDKIPIEWDQEKIKHKDWDEVKKVDQRVPSGSMPSCVSDYGVYDIVGNVDEEYQNTIGEGTPHPNVMMSGHWMRGARNMCRGRTLVHNEWFYIYEAGGRCCKDPQ